MLLRQSMCVLCALFLVAGAHASPSLVPESCPTPPASDQKPWLDTSYSPPCRAKFVLDQLASDEDKLALIEAPGFGAPPGQRDIMKELGLETGRGSDGPAGFNGGTAWPTPLTLAASFDPDLAERYGLAVGQEFFDSGRNQMLGPAMDMTRTWHFGRSTESFGEDPYLAASIVAREVAAIQSRHVITMIKHFAAYTQEQARLGDNPIGFAPAVNQVISERVLREVYFPTFRAAVKKGRAGAVMCSFPRINGTYACENTYTLGALKNDWGFDGLVGPDFPVAQRSVVPAIRAGLDSGQFEPRKGPQPPGATPDLFAGQSLRAALAKGEISHERLNDLVMRRLVAGFRVGTFDHPAKPSGQDVTTAEAVALATKIITEGAVLLKNEKAVLPFGPDVKSIAVIGTQAGDEANVVEQGSPYVEPKHLVTALVGIKKRAGDTIKVTYAPGMPGLRGGDPIPADELRTPDGKPGLAADYIANPKLDFSEKPLLSRIEPGVNNASIPKIDGLPANKLWSVRWRGSFVPSESGLEAFMLSGSGTAKLYIGGKLRDEFDNADFGARAYAAVDVKKGVPVPIEVQYTARVTLADQERQMFGTTMGPVVKMSHAPASVLIQEAVNAARKTDVAVVFAGQIVGEGADRAHLGLPPVEDALIEAVANVNPRTVVVLTTGGAVTMPWLSKVAAVVEMWLPGDSFGTAAAELLFGDAAPGGRLPVTFPANETQGPGQSIAEYPGTPDKTGSPAEVHFDEGLAIGYRYWDAHGQTPLFPFGYGLSYSKFKVSNIALQKTGQGATVEATIRNVGKRAAADVIQVYVGFPKSTGEPPKQLKAFKKVTLAPGTSITIEIPLGPEAFQIWDEKSHGWMTVPGNYQIMVGQSSRHLLATHVLKLGE
jgi:beta-glucosidase